MYEGTPYGRYMDEVRNQVCKRCIERPPEGPPCAPHGKRCGLELDLPTIVGAIQGVRSLMIDPYIDQVHDKVCAGCPNQPTNQCPCPLESLLPLVVQAIETVDHV